MSLRRLQKLLSPKDQLFVMVHASSPDRFLNIARSMNSDLGKHIKNNSFSVNLAGRFYENNSMENNDAKQRKVTRMKEKRKQLLEEIKEEEKLISSLEKKLRLRDLARREALMKRRIAERGVVQLQSYARRKRMQKRYTQMKIELDATRYIAIFLQRRYRGYRGRKRAFARADQLWEETRHAASILVQAQMRSFLARLLLKKLKLDRIEMCNNSAVIIQKITRGLLARRVFRMKLAGATEKRRRNAATSMQTIVRGYFARNEVARMKLTLKERKPPRKKKVRKSSMRGDAVRRTFVVPAATKRQSNENCWSLVRASVRNGDQSNRRATMDVAPRTTRSSLVGRPTMRMSVRKAKKGSDSTNSSDQYRPTEREAVMMKRLSNASQAAIQRHQREANVISMKRRLRCCDEKSTVSQDDDETVHSSSVANSSLLNGITEKESSIIRRLSDAKDKKIQRNTLGVKAKMMKGRASSDEDNSSSQDDEETVRSESSQNESNATKGNKIPNHIFPCNSSVISKVTAASDCSFNSSTVVETVETSLDQIVESARHSLYQDEGESRVSVNNSSSCNGSETNTCLDKRRDSMSAVMSAEHSLAGFAIIDALDDTSEKVAVCISIEHEDEPTFNQGNASRPDDLSIELNACDNVDLECPQQSHPAPSAEAFDNAEFEEEFEEDMDDLCFSQT